MNDMKNLVLFFASIFLLGIFTFSELNAQEAKSNIKELTESNFNTSIKKGLVLVDFYADWCGPCKVVHPILEELKTKMNDEVIILKINVDKNAKMSAKYQIQSIPTLILFRNGKIKWRQSGVVPLKQLQQIISEHSK